MDLMIVSLKVIILSQLGFDRDWLSIYQYCDLLSSPKGLNKETLL